MYIGAMPDLDSTDTLKAVGGAVAGAYILPNVLPPKYKTFAMITGAIAGWMLAGKAMRSELYGYVSPETPKIGMTGWGPMNGWGPMAGWGPVAGLSDHETHPQVQPNNVVTLD